MGVVRRGTCLSTIFASPPSTFISWARTAAVASTAPEARNARREGSVAAASGTAFTGSVRFQRAANRSAP